MAVPGNNNPYVTHYIRNMRGGSQPILAQAGDGFLYIVKFNNNLQGANLPFNESVGTELYHAAGLAAPGWKPMRVTNSFLDRNPDCWIQTPEGRLRPESGLCFGSRFLGGTGIHLQEILPGTSLKRVSNHQDFWLAWLIDICAGHADNRQSIFRETAQDGLTAFFFDNGHLFGGPNGEIESHFMASRYLDPRIYENVSLQYLQGLPKAAAALDVDGLWKRVRALPEEWKATSALNRFEQCLQRVSTPILVQSIVETMVDADERSRGYESNESQFGRKGRVSVLFPGVQATELGWRIVPI
jgi:hypothetical protein